MSTPRILTPLSLMSSKSYLCAFHRAERECSAEDNGGKTCYKAS